MTQTPTLSLLFVRAMNKLVDVFLERHDTWTESGLSREIFGYPEGLKSLRAYDGSNNPPTTKNMVQVEAFVRHNLDEDAEKSEQIYRQTIGAVIAEGAYPKS